MTNPNPMSEKSIEYGPKLYKFVGYVFIWMIPCFGIWMSLNSALVSPAVWITDFILTYTFPEVVHEISLNGKQALLSTHFGKLDSGEIVSARIAGYRLAFPMNTQILSYSIPFYSALYLATLDGGSWAKYGKGLLVLYTLIIVGMLSICLKNLMLGLGTSFVDGFSTEASIIGIMYQISTLIVPSVAPVIVWAWQARESSILKQLLLGK